LSQVALGCDDCFSILNRIVNAPTDRLLVEFAEYFEKQILKSALSKELKSKAAEISLELSKEAVCSLTENTLKNEIKDILGALEIKRHEYNEDVDVLFKLAGKACGKVKVQ
jgi:hypothetical protein